MKNPFFNQTPSVVIFCFFTLGIGTVGFAQTNTPPVGPAITADKASPTPPPSPEGTRPTTVSLHLGHLFSSGHSHATGNPLKALLTRFTTLDIDSLVADQRTTGIHEKSYFASISASGVMVYDSELRTHRSVDAYAKTGRDVGLQILPFTVALGEQGQYYVAFSIAALRNMNALQNSTNCFHEYNNQGSNTSGFFKIVDNIDFMVFKFDERYSFANLNQLTLNYAQVDAKLDILGSSIPSRYLAIKVGGSVGSDFPVLYADGHPNYLGTQMNPNGTTNQKGALTTGVDYGLEYNTVSNHGFKINVQAVVDCKWTSGLEEDYEHVQSYQKAYKQYLSNGSVGAAPVDNQTVNFAHNAFYFRPSLELSQRTSSSTSSRPKSIGLTVSGNVPISDVIQNEGTLGRIDLSPYNNQLVKVKLVLHF